MIQWCLKFLVNNNVYNDDNGKDGDNHYMTYIVYKGHMLMYGWFKPFKTYKILVNACIRSRGFRVFFFLLLSDCKREFKEAIWKIYIKNYDSLFQI